MKHCLTAGPSISGSQTWVKGATLAEAMLVSLVLAAVIRGGVFALDLVGDYLRRRWWGP